MQTLGSSICGLNREISTQALEVVTVEEEGFAVGPQRLIQALQSFQRGPCCTSQL